MISIVTTLQVLKTQLKQPNILIHLTTLRKLSNLQSKGKKLNSLNIKITLFRMRSGKPKFLKKKDVKPFNMKQKWAREGLSIQLNLTSREINKRCNIRNKWLSRAGKLMNRVFKDKSRWEEIRWNMNIS